MSNIEGPDFLDTLKNEAKYSKPDILPKNTKFESYIGHTIINLSDAILQENQIRALEKGLTFCPTPEPPYKSQIWLDFKEFHRRFELMEFFSRDNKNQTDQSIIDFMSKNASDTQDDTTNEEDLNSEIQSLTGDKILQIEPWKYFKDQLNKKC